MTTGEISDSWDLGDPYEQYVGRWSRRVAPLFLSWLRVPSGLRWLDLGCGTGALCAAILDHCAPATVTGVEPSEGFLETAKKNFGGRADLRRGSATSIPLADHSIDVVVSGLMLNFVADPLDALAEMTRVTTDGGTIAAYLWDYAGRMELMRHFWDAAAELDPRAGELDEGVRFPLCHPNALQHLFLDADLSSVEVTPIDLPTPFANFDDYWQPFLGGQGPAPAWAMSLDEKKRNLLRDLVRKRLPVESDGSISLIARAWAVRGSVTAPRPVI